MMNFIKNHWGSLLGLTILGVLIWYAGDITRYFSDYPSVLLDSRAFRVLLMVLLVMLWLTIQLVAQLRAKKREEGLHNELTEETLRAQEDVGHNRERFLKVLEKLKVTSRHRSSWKAFLKPNLYLYDEKPWYIIIGPSRTGKTTILKNSGLHFNFQDDFEQEISGSGSTLYCDWWFSDEAVLLDTAGRYFTQDDQQAVDSTGWLGLVDLLKKYRPRRPVNGVIIAFDLSRLLDQEELQLDKLIRFTKHRLIELEQRLQVTLPVYCVFTKCDLVAGFQESFYRLTPQALEQVWGITFSDKDEKETKNVVSLFDNKFDELIKRLHEQLLERLHLEKREDNSHHQPRARMYNFPQQMALLKAPLNRFLTEIFRARAYGKEQPVRLRGVYFTSATQEGSPIDLLIKRLGDDFHLPPPLIDTEAGQGRSYFVKKLFTAVMFKERNLVGLHRRLEIRNQAIYWGTTGLAVLIVGVLGWHWWNSYGNNQEEMRKLDNPARNDSLLVYKRTEGNSDREVEIPKEPDFKGILPALNALREAVEKGYAECKQDQQKQENCTLYPYQGPSVPETPESIPVPWNLQWGLYQGEELQEKARLAYYRMLDKVFLRHIAAYLRNDLQQKYITLNDQDPYSILYPALRIYLVLRQDNISNLYRSQNSDQGDTMGDSLAAELRNQLIKTWEAGVPYLYKDFEVKQLKIHLETLLNRLKQGPPVEAIQPQVEGLYSKEEKEEKLVEQVRKTWEDRNPAKLFYRDLENSERVRTVSVFGKNLDTSVRGAFSGKSMENGVSGFYTREIFCQFNDLSKTTMDNKSVENWVSGQFKFDEKKVTSIKQEMQSLYVEDYLKEWEKFLDEKTLTVAEAKLSNKGNLEVLIDDLATFPQTETSQIFSPLLLLLGEIAKNTRLQCFSLEVTTSTTGIKSADTAKTMGQAATVIREVGSFTGSGTLSQGAQALDAARRGTELANKISSGVTGRGGEIGVGMGDDFGNKIRERFKNLNNLVDNHYVAMKPLIDALSQLHEFFKTIKSRSSMDAEMTQLGKITTEEMTKFEKNLADLESEARNLKVPVVEKWIGQIVERSRALIHDDYRSQQQKETKEQQAKKDQERLVAEQEQLRVKEEQKRVKEEQKNNLRIDQAKDRQTLVAEQQQAVKELQIGQTKEREKLRTDQDRDREKWRVDHEQGKAKLNAKWKTQVYEVYERVLKDGYPLSSGKKKDIKLDDFTSFFKPGNTMENLVNEANDFLVQQRQSGESLLTKEKQVKEEFQQRCEQNAKNLLDQEKTKWQSQLEKQREDRKQLDPDWQEEEATKANLPTLDTLATACEMENEGNTNAVTMNPPATLPVEVTSAMENTKKIGQAFFPDGQLSMGFRLKPYDADPAVVDTVILDFYGESWSYEVGTPKLSKNFQWPKPAGTDQVRLKLKFKDGREETFGETCNGDWAWFKFLDEAKLEKKGDNFQLHITVAGSTVIYDLEAMRELNPFTDEVKNALHDFRVSPDLF